MKARRFGMPVAGIVLAVLVIILPLSIGHAEEGMYMMDKLDQLNLKKAGLKIKTSDIYNPNGTGLSIAAPRLSIGCSSSFVSPDGLILTNHHCAFDALVSASTTKENLADTGYRAQSRADELPAKGYAVDLTLKEEDVTAKVLAGIAEGDQKAIDARIAELQKQEQDKAGADKRVQIQPLTQGLYYYLFVYKRINDVRVVYAPPSNIGYYGGDPDNFEWTRHAGDFTFLRAYVAPDGSSAEYSKDNVPYKPAKYLAVSSEGIKENDLTMIIGYPGRTNRYRESFSVDYNQNERLPFLIDMLATRVKAYEMIGSGDPEKAVELQSEIFSLNNVIKAFEGAVLAMRRGRLIQEREASEAKLTAWVDADPARKAKYGEALPGLKAAYGAESKFSQKDLVLQYLNSVPTVQLIGGNLMGVQKERLKAAVPQFAGAEPIENRELVKFLLRKAAALPAGQKIDAVEKLFGSMSNEARIKAEEEFAKNVTEDESVTTEAGLNSFVDMSADQLKASKHPLVSFVVQLMPDFEAMNDRNEKLGAALEKNRLPFIKAMTEMKKANPYPDANSTQRFSYGRVKGYSPREAVTYTPFTTLDGIFQKDTGREPFNAPAKLKELWERKDYGNHAVNGTVPLDFLTTNDIIGGNSGSPVMNAKGELIGLAFDGNYEGLGNDFFFNPALGRTIVVDIRYVMFLTDKFGDASWILKEMDIRGGKKAKAAGK